MKAVTHIVMLRLGNRKAKIEAIFQTNSSLGFMRNLNMLSAYFFLHFSHCFCVVVFFYIFQHTLFTYPYHSVITFGGCCDDFMVVTSQQGESGVGKKNVEKLVFAMAKPKVSAVCISRFSLFLCFYFSKS